MLVPLNSPHQIECPHCRRHTLVRHGESEYVCLNCNFRRDLTHDQFWGVGSFWMMGLMAFVLVVLLSAVS